MIPESAARSVDRQAGPSLPQENVHRGACAHCSAERCVRPSERTWVDRKRSLYDGGGRDRRSSLACANGWFGMIRGFGITRFASRLLLAILWIYQRSLSPFLSFWFHSGCRFWPTCSAYAGSAISAHGAVRGLWLAARRLGRCRPGGGFGVDPVPPPPPPAGGEEVA